MNQVRIHGDPFGDDLAASLLRSFLRLCLGSGVHVSLSLAAVQPRPPVAGQRVVSLTDGVRDLHVGTHLPTAEIELLMRATDEVVASTAPVVVFAEASRRDDAVREAGLIWPRAATVLPVREQATPADLLERVRAELRWAGVENPPHALEPRELAPWLSLPVVAARGAVVTVGGRCFDDGLDLAIAAWRRVATRSHALRIVLTAPEPALREEVLAALGDDAEAAEIVTGNLEPAHVRDAVAVLLPWRRAQTTRVLVQALASGRPVCASRCAATAALLDRPGTCLPIGGVDIGDEAVHTAHFAPHEAALLHALREALADPARAAAIGRRSRVFVGEELLRGRPASPPPPVPASVPARPVVVLEAPFFETSSTAELSIATAQALCARDRVDVRLVVDTPLRERLPWLRARAPELVGRLVRHPGDVDLWLASGWPVRASRPPCRTFALRVDQEFGTLPVELMPHVTQDADVVVVHSEHVHRTLAAAGRPQDRIRMIPHGVDASLHDGAAPNPAIAAWKGALPAVLFCGGLIWRKGFDLFLQTMLAARARGAEFAVVVKAVGRGQHYGRYHLEELLERFVATPGTPPVFVVGGDVARSDLAGIYTACDVLVHPYRGEGFCLPVLEARACGLPVIATGGGATDALMAGPGAHKIRSKRRPVDLPTPHVAAPWVLEPSVADAGRLLVEVLADLPRARREARAFASAVRSTFPWDAAASAIETLAFAAAGKRRVPLPAGEPLFTLPASAPEPAPLAEPVAS